jgi:hypothetical protein
MGRETEIHTQRKWWVFQGSWEVIKDKPGKGFATKSS